MKTKNIKSRTAQIAVRLKKLASLGLIAAGTFGTSVPAKAAVQEHLSIAQRVTKVRHAIVELASDDGSLPTPGIKTAGSLLAQWGNAWQNWNNWNQWYNWPNWGNIWINY